jgi:hypothetical protein
MLFLLGLFAELLDDYDMYVALAIAECDQLGTECAGELGEECKMAWNGTWQATTEEPVCGFDGVPSDICIDKLCDKICKTKHYDWCKKGGLSTGALVGIIVGGILGVNAIVVTVVIIYMRKKKRDDTTGWTGGIRVYKV